MKTIPVALSAALCITALVLGASDDPNVGSWRLNEAKSTISAGVPKNTSVVYTALGESYKCVVDGVDAAGKPSHNEWTGKFDGKDYPVTGDPTADTRSLKRDKANHYTITNKKGGKQVLEGTVTFSADLKTRTLTTHATDAAGKKVTATSVYDRR
jgi:hypothetical protein